MGGVTRGDVTRPLSEGLVPATEQLTAVQPLWEADTSPATWMGGYTSVRGVLVMP